jgi:hypothetical protein
MGVKIPDVGYIDSGTLSMVQRQGITVNSNGITGIALGCAVGAGTFTTLIPTGATNNCGNNGGTAWVNLVTIGSTAVNTAPFSVAASTAGVSPVQLPGISNIAAILTQWRLVSLSIRVIPATSATSDNGFYTICALPGGYFDSSNLLSSYTEAQLQNLPGAQIIPINQGSVELKYFPKDLSNLDYANASFVPTSYATAAPWDVGQFVVYLSGATSTTSHLATITYNWEYLPAVGTLMFGITPSYSDPLAVSTAINMMQDVPPVGPAKNDNEFDMNTVPKTTSVVALPNASLMCHSQMISRPQAWLSKRSKRSNPPPSFSSQTQEKSLFEKFVDIALPVVSRFVSAL